LPKILGKRPDVKSNNPHEAKRLVTNTHGLPMQMEIIPQNRPVQEKYSE